MILRKLKKTREKMNLSEKTIDLLKNDKIARTIIKKLLDAQYSRFTYVEGRNAKVTTGGMLKFDYPDEEVHRIAKELCSEGILDFHIGITLPIYYLKGERPIEETATPRNNELRRTIAQYFK